MSSKRHFKRDGQMFKRKGTCFVFSVYAIILSGELSGRAQKVRKLKPMPTHLRQTPPGQLLP